MTINSEYIATAYTDFLLLVDVRLMLPFELCRFPTLETRGKLSRVQIRKDFL